MGLDFKPYERVSFEVEAVQVTKENIQEVAQLIGQLDKSANPAHPRIRVNPKKVPNIRFVNIGWWVTRVGDYYRCYKPKLFNEHYKEK